MLWAYWPSSKNADEGGIVVLTTHLTAGPRTPATHRAKSAQIDAICGLLSELRARFGERNLETYVCGDFNLIPSVPSHLALLRKLERVAGLRRIAPSSYDEAGCAKDVHTHVGGFQCDFIFGPASPRSNASKDKEEDKATTIAKTVPPVRKDPDDGWIISDHCLVCAVRE
eukprot:g3113.t1